MVLENIMVKKYCTQCGNKIFESYRICPYCNYEFETESYGISDSINDKKPSDYIVKSDSNKHLSLNEIREAKFNRERKKEEIIAKQIEDRHRRAKIMKEDSAQYFNNFSNSINEKILKIITKYENMPLEKKKLSSKKIEDENKTKSKEYKSKCKKYYNYNTLMTNEEKVKFKNDIKKIAKDQYNLDIDFITDKDYLGLYLAIEKAYWGLCLKYYDKGVHAEKNGNISSAIQYYENVVRLKFDAPASYDRLIYIYNQKDDIKNQKRIINEALTNCSKLKNKKIKSYENQLYLLDKGGIENLTIFEVINRFNDYDLVNYSNKYYSNNKEDLAALNELIPVINKAIFNGRISDYTTAKMYRLKGEIALANGNNIDALDNFQEALILNEKIGVKRKYKKLLKELESN